MRKHLTFILTAAMLVTFAGCGKATGDTSTTAVNETKEVESAVTQENVVREDVVQESTVQESVAPEVTEKPTHVFTQIKESPDKYTWYIKDYVGKNCATLGYTSYNGMRYDEYGAGVLRLIFVTADGSYVDVESEDALKEYAVIGQSLEPNAELKLTFEKDSEGNESEYSVIHQTYKELVLMVKKVGTEEVYGGAATVVNPSPDKYTWYISDYVGRNLADCGYVSYRGDICDEYGAGGIRFVVVAEDGSFVDPEDEGQLRGYKVVGQSAAPNTELKYTFEKNGDGVESDTFVESQNFYEIDLYVSPIPGYLSSILAEEVEITKTEEAVVVENEVEPEGTVTVEVEVESEETESEEVRDELVDGMRPEFKEAMDSYEEFYREYCDFMVKYNQNPSDLTLMAEYYQLLVKMQEMDEDFAAWTDGELNDEEFEYYLEVSERVMDMLLEVTG